MKDETIDSGDKAEIEKKNAEELARYWRRNKEFQITWCETNIRWLDGESPSEKRDTSILYMMDEIRRLKEKLG
jgi:hypothetical protein